MNINELLENIKQLDESIEKKDAFEIEQSLKLFNIEKLGNGAKRAILHLPRKALTVFSPRGELPWELFSWESIRDKIIFLGSYLDIGRMGSGTSISTASAVWGSISEVHEPMFSFERLLFALDKDVDNIIGDPLEKLIAEALEQGFMVDALVPAERLSRILTDYGTSDRLIIRDISNKSKLLHLLDNNNYAVIFIAAHGGEPKTIGHLIFANEELLEHELPKMSGYPIIVLNSCWTGRAVYDNLQKANSGIAVKLLDRGAFQIIAPIYPVSGASAALISEALLANGLIRSAARVLRQTKNKIESASKNNYAHYTTDVRWFVAYGDSISTKFFDIDGITEMEDVVEKVTKMVPILDEKIEMSESERVQIIDLYQRLSKTALNRAKNWGESALYAIEDNLILWGTAGIALLKNAKDEQRRLTEIIDQSVVNIDRIVEKLLNSKS